MAERGAFRAATVRHPRFRRRYDEFVFLPMLERRGYLRANGFKTIVSGGGIEVALAADIARIG